MRYILEFRLVISATYSYSNQIEDVIILRPSKDNSVMLLFVVMKFKCYAIFLKLHIRYIVKLILINNIGEIYKSHQYAQLPVNNWAIYLKELIFK